MESPQHFTLKQITSSIRRTISERYNRTYWVTAEMHKLNETRKGHCYPELVQKEDGLIIAEMRGTIWASQFERIQAKFSSIVKEPIRDGLELLFLVKITYHPIYNIGLEIVDIDPNYTLGALQRERQETLERLNKEGILNANQNVHLALLPKRLAIISQADSKGYSDFVTLLNGHPKRYHFNSFLFEATLQGDAAISSIQTQLERIARVKHHFDAVVIIRGGGGEIGMHCYNNYELAKAIATFPLPVLTGIGHSTNLTVCEMIAFRNGITPSDMAYFLLGIFEELDAPLDEALLTLPSKLTRLLLAWKNSFDKNTLAFQKGVTTNLKEQNSDLQNSVKDFEYAVGKGIQTSKQALSENRKDLRTSSLQLLFQAKTTSENNTSKIGLYAKGVLGAKQNKLGQQTINLNQGIPRVLITSKERLNQIERHLLLVDPIHVLKRGYAIVTNTNGVLSEKNKAKKGEELNIQTAAEKIKAIIK